MAEASGVTIELIASAVPLIGPTLKLSESGCLTRAWKSTLESLGPRFKTQGVAEPLVGVLADAQTSGGLLIAVAPDRADEALAALASRIPWPPAVVGRVAPKSDVDVILYA